MIFTRCLLLMTALAVNTLVAGQPIPAQGDKPIDESQQEITTGMVPEQSIQGVDSDGANPDVYRTTMGTVAEEPAPDQVDTPTEEGAQETAMNMVSVEPALLQEDGSANGGEQELPMGKVAGEPGEPGEPVLYESIDELEPVLTMEMVSENPPFIDPEGKIVWTPDGVQYLEDNGGDQLYAMNMAPQEQMGSDADGPPPWHHVHDCWCAYHTGTHFYYGTVVSCYVWVLRGRLLWCRNILAEAVLHY
jgi:hypothetical protein